MATHYPIIFEQEESCGSRHKGPPVSASAVAISAFPRPKQAKTDVGHTRGQRLEAGRRTMSHGSASGGHAIEQSGVLLN